LISIIVIVSMYFLRYPFSENGDFSDTDSALLSYVSGITLLLIFVFFN